MQPLVFIFILSLRFELDELLTNYQRVRLNLIGSRKQLDRIQENIDQLQVCSGYPTQVLVILSGSGYPTRFRLSYQVPVILQGSSHPTRFRSSYQVQVILPGSGHSTRFHGHLIRFRSSDQVPVIRLQSSLFIIFLF